MFVQKGFFEFAWGRMPTLPARVPEGPISVVCEKNNLWNINYMSVYPVKRHAYLTGVVVFSRAPRLSAGSEINEGLTTGEHHESNAKDHSN